MNKILLRLPLFLFFFSATTAFTQDDLLKLVQDSVPARRHVTAAFKSTRVINSQSIEFLGKGVLDVRILHRFGPVDKKNSFFGLDEARMRLGFDYGITKNLMVGVGRSTYDKEYDGFLKWRPIWQGQGPHTSPVSVVLVGDATVNSMPWDIYTQNGVPVSKLDQKFSTRVAYYGGIIVGRKFGERFSAQVTPEMVYRTLVPDIGGDHAVFATGIGARYKFSRRMALVVDYHHIFSGLPSGTYQDPVAVGIDIETGGHVFQLHFSNSRGMNERAFLTGTGNSENAIEKGIRFGFNLSRVFTLAKPKGQTEAKKW